MTCKDCMHYEICRSYGEDYIEDGIDKICYYYNSKSHFIELPCNIGDIFYEIFIHRTCRLRECKFFDHKYEQQIFYCDGCEDCVIHKNILPFKFTISDYDRVMENLGKTIFLTYEEAENRLKEHINE